MVKLFFLFPPLFGEIYKFPCLPRRVAATQSKKSIPRSTASKMSATSAIPKRCRGFSSEKYGTHQSITLYNVSFEEYEPPMAIAEKWSSVNFADAFLRCSNI